MPLDPKIAAYYTQLAPMTDPGDQAAALDSLPSDVVSLAAVTQGLYLHEHIAPAYGVAVSDERRAEVHVRRVRDRIAAILERDAAPLMTPREPAERMISDCRHSTVTLVAMLRRQGVPARSRCGFGGYFEPGEFGDHWVAEYWDAARDRWVLSDAQIDDVQRDLFKIDFDLLDVPRDRFLVAGDAWVSCREGRADPSKFGIMDMRGLWFIAGNLLRDIAALNNVEALPWDVWGAMAQPGEEIPEDRLAYYDRLAELSRDPDANFDELCTTYENDEGVRVPATVLNAVLGRMEPF